MNASLVLMSCQKQFMNNTLYAEYPGLVMPKKRSVVGQIMQFLPTEYILLRPNNSVFNFTPNKIT